MGVWEIGKKITPAVRKILYSHLNLNPALIVFSSFYLSTFVLVLYDIYTNLGGKY